jgi:hypothetical protein
VYELFKEEWEKYGGCVTNLHTAQEAVHILRNKEYHLTEIMADYVKDLLLVSIKTKGRLVHQESRPERSAHRRRYF